MILVGSALVAAGQEKPQRQNNYYEEQLQALKETSMGTLPSEGVTQSYRLVWLRTFDHPVVVGVDVLPDGTGRVRTKETGEPGGLCTGKAYQG